MRYNSAATNKTLRFTVPNQKLTAQQTKRKPSKRTYIAFLAASFIGCFLGTLCVLTEDYNEALTLGIFALLAFIGAICTRMMSERTNGPWFR